MIRLVQKTINSATWKMCPLDKKNTIRSWKISFDRSVSNAFARDGIEKRNEEGNYYLFVYCVVVVLYFLNEGGYT